MCCHGRSWKESQLITSGLRAFRSRPSTKGRRSLHQRDPDGSGLLRKNPPPEPVSFTADSIRSQPVPVRNEIAGRSVGGKVRNIGELVMRTFYQKLAERLHSIEDHLTVRTQIAAAIAMMSILVVGTLAAGAAWGSYNNT